MPDRNRSAPPSASRVIDLGSNSLRLVVFERLGADVVPAASTKRSCAALGRGIASTGRLNPDGVALAWPICSALSRSPARLPSIISRSRNRRGARRQRRAAPLPPRSNASAACRSRSSTAAEEARLSAAGVLAGIPDADGIVADLGGGSVELVRVDAATAPAIGDGVSACRSGRFASPSSATAARRSSETIERALTAAPVLRDAPAGSALSGRRSVRARSPGCTWSRRNIRCTSSTSTRSPRREAEGFLDIIGRQSRQSLERITDDLAQASRGGAARGDWSCAS